MRAGAVASSGARPRGVSKGLRLVGAGPTATEAGTAASIDVTLPTEAERGDLLILAVGEGDDPTLTGPAGWTEIGNYRTGAESDRTLGVWYRVCDGTEGATATVTMNATLGPIVGVCVAFRGQDRTTPVGATDVQGNLYNDQSPASNAGLACSMGDVAVYALVCSSKGSIAPDSITEPAGSIPLVLALDVGGDCTFGLAYELLAGPTVPVEDWALPATGMTADSTAIAFVIKAGQ